MSVPTASTPAGLLQSLLAALPGALPTTLTASGPSPSRGDDLYEAYLFGVVVRAAVADGYTVRIETPDGRPAPVLRLRRGPGRIMSAPVGGGGFTHAVLSTPGRPDLELHTNIRLVGRSGVLHEADVLLIPATDAARYRATSVDPPSRYAHLVIEAKYYTQGVDLALGRQFLGLSKDLSAKHMVFVSTIAARSTAALLAGTPSVAHDDGVLPGLQGEQSFESLMTRLLRNYRLRR